MIFFLEVIKILTYTQAFIYYMHYILRLLHNFKKYYLIQQPFCHFFLSRRGPIWIPINYLVLGALHYYSQQIGPEQLRCQSHYSTLRKNVQENILTNVHSTGFMWEQYDDATGKGIRGHPFSGWTSLLTNIMAEKYQAHTGYQMYMRSNGLEDEQFKSIAQNTLTGISVFPYRFRLHKWFLLPFHV